MDAKGVQAQSQGGPHHHPSSPNNLEKGVYRILMNKMEMDSKGERFFIRIQLRMNGRHRCASVELGSHPHHPFSPNNLEKGLYQILMNKMEMDGKDEQFLGRIQARMNGHHRCASTGSGGHHPNHSHHPSSPVNLEKGVCQNLMNKMEMDDKDEQFFGRIQLRMNGYHRCASTGSGGPPPLLPQQHWKGILLGFDYQAGDGPQKWTIF